MREAMIRVPIREVQDGVPFKWHGRDYRKMHDHPGGVLATQTMGLARGFMNSEFIGAAAMVEAMPARTRYFNIQPWLTESEENIDGIF